MLKHDGPNVCAIYMENQSTTLQVSWCLVRCIISHGYGISNCSIRAYFGMWYLGKVHELCTRVTYTRKSDLKLCTRLL